MEDVWGLLMTGLGFEGDIMEEFPQTSEVDGIRKVDIESQVREWEPRR